MRQTFFLGLALAFVATGWATADEDIQTLIEQLDADRYTERQAAEELLEKLGPDAVEALTETAINGSREASLRAVLILTRHAESEDKALAKAGQEALTKVAESKTPAAASRAKVALDRINGVEKPMPQRPVAPAQPVPGIQIGPGIQIQIQGGGAQVQRIRVQAGGNGQMEIEAEENGQKVKIQRDAAGKIEMQVTEKNQEGKEETKQYSAKDEEEFKKQHPEAYKLYDKYAHRNRGIQIRNLQIPPGRAVPLPIQPLPVRPRAVPALPRNPGLQDAQERIDEAIERMKKLAQDAVDDNTRANLQQAIEQLEKSKADLKKMSGLRRRIRAQAEGVQPAPADDKAEDATEEPSEEDSKE